MLKGFVCLVVGALTSLPSPLGITGNNNGGYRSSNFGRGAFMASGRVGTELKCGLGESFSRHFYFGVHTKAVQSGPSHPDNPPSAIERKTANNAKHPFPSDQLDSITPSTTLRL